MNIRTGNLWNHLDEADLVFVTTNGMVRNDGRLVMGGGIAKEAQTRFPELPKWFGKQVKAKGSIYHLLVHPDWPLGGWKKIGAFQTKIDWVNNSSADLISHSLNKLCEFAEGNPTKTIFLNYPGIGLGGLPEATVEQLLRDACLPSNVHIWKL